MSAQPSPTTCFDVLIVGSGFGGLCAAVALAAEGKRTFVVLERAQELGGTWRDNTYPGSSCDIPSHLYSFSFAPNPDWSRMYPTQPEIRAYLQHVAHKYGVLPHIRFGRTLRSASFDAARGLWRVDTVEGERFETRVLISATGGLSRPRVPPLAGIERFRGPRFHSARWDHGFDLAGKRVAVIGTGASAVQSVPEIAQAAQQVHVFQRSAPWIFRKPDRAMRDWERGLFRWLPFTQQLLRGRIFCSFEALGSGIFVRRDNAPRAERSALRYIEREIADPELRRKVTPDYAIGCKRIVFSNDWYSTLQRPNVELVTDPIEHFDEEAVITADGHRRVVDCVIYGTGFDVHGISRLDVRGLNGLSLAQVWAASREAYLGCTAAGFPNLFFIVGPNSGTAHNSLVYIIESQVRYVMKLLRCLDRKRALWLQPRPDAQRAYNEQLQAKLANSVWATGGCQSWYRDPAGRITTMWPKLLLSYRRATRRVDERMFEWEESGLDA